jgi:hypothetical protein
VIARDVINPLGPDHQAWVRTLPACGIGDALLGAWDNASSRRSLQAMRTRTG